MKKLMILAVVLFSGALFAQNAKPVLEPFGKKIKATYFHENGQVQQVGYFENGKLEGIWVSYDESGNRIATGEYAQGVKTGKWLFWNDEQLAEVAYSENNVMSVKNWAQEAVVTK